jgi:3-mercaptopyruvate sulfurtransferase SseA
MNLTVVMLYTEQTKKISANDLKSRLNRKDKGLLLVDARDVTVYYKGHIPGAISLFDGTIMPMAKDLDKNMDIIVYGPGQAQPSKDPMDRLAGDAIDRFSKMGFKNCMALDGGLEAWANAGNRVDTSKPESVKPVDMLSYDQLRQFLGGMGGF